MSGEEFLDPEQRARHAEIRAITGPGGVDRTELATHSMCGTTIELDGDRASVATTCLVHLVGLRDGERAMVVRGIHHADTFIRRGPDWRILERTHSARWMHQAEIS
jgi:hypothetical protein